MTKFTKQQVGGKGKYIYELKSTDKNGFHVWHFIMVAPAKVNAFLNAKKQPIFDLRDYGEILKSGYGSHPPKEVIDEINEKYGLDFAA